MLLVALVAASSPRRVGDGGEYLAMAMNLSAFRPPSLSQSDLHRVERRFQQIGHGYEVVPLEMPALRGRDGRQDFPHFWLYPLLAVPALWLTDAIGAHPNHAFTILNVVIAGGAFVLLVRRASLSIAVLILASPVMWWIDKVHGDVFTVSLLAIGFALLASADLEGPPHDGDRGRDDGERGSGGAYRDRVANQRGAALVALGAVAAQNPPLAPVFALSLAWVLARTYVGAGLQAGPHLQASPRLQAGRRRRRLRYGAGAGTALAVWPIIYYESRLGVPTPIVGWTKVHFPTIREVGAFIWDPNLGLAVNHPAFAIVAIGAAIVALRRRRLTVLSAWLPLACAAVLLAGFAQSVNVNHGATPGMNRWTLWLTTLAIPLLVGMEVACRPRRALGTAAIASLLWSVVWFQPARAEEYKAPTRTARWIWAHAPWLDNPPAEIFGERASGAEPPQLPVATADCRKVLAIDGAWPVPCLPPPNPSAACTMSGSACYANANESAYGFTPTRFPSGLDFHRARAWPLDAAFARNLRSALDEVGVQGLAPAAAGQSGAMLRAAHGVAWTYALQASDRLFVYIPEAGDGAVLTLRLPGPMGGGFIDLRSGERLIGIVRGGEPWAVWDVRVPAGKRHLALVMKMTR